MSATLLLDAKKDRPVTLAQLKKMPDPQPLGDRHRPYRYDEIVETLIGEAVTRGYDVVKNEMILSRGEKMLLGVMQLRHEDAKDRTIADTNLQSDLALGYRGSHSQLSSFKCVAGESVLLCSNLIMAGDMFIVARKFTTNLAIADAVCDGFNKFVEKHSIMEKRIRRLAETDIGDTYAKELTFEAITRGGLPMQVARDVAKWYFGEAYGGPEELPEDTAPRTLFGLHNAFTRSLREYAAQPRFEHTKAVGKLFGL